MHAGDLCIKNGGLPAKTHRTDSQFIGFLSKTLLQLRKFRVCIASAYFTEQHFLRLYIRRAAVSPNGHTQNTGCAACKAASTWAVKFKTGARFASACVVAPAALGC